MTVPSKVLIFVVPQTCMSVYYHDNSDLYPGLGRYKGWPVEIVSPNLVFGPIIWVWFSRFVMQI